MLQCKVCLGHYGNLLVLSDTIQPAAQHVMPWMHRDRPLQMTVALYAQPTVQFLFSPFNSAATQLGPSACNNIKLAKLIMHVWEFPRSAKGPKDSVDKS